MTSPRLTKPTIGVLNCLLTADDSDPVWGLRICTEADLGSGTVYPILERLADLGWVESWPETSAHPGRPGRLFYRLTADGRLRAAQALEARATRRTSVLRLAGGTA
ncbi:helix-turn-helix transcriptional regulator [Kitasatospora sp. NBC_01300]|uniref:PadR family transcriptional regulator n=1 Tax=Kitasatospora sp. NBC_01300 TaxID=2903574 RepID=UPI002F906EC3|nr:PadR family transcriptional regulator [Kitasatospora sp. NBC_01300]